MNRIEITEINRSAFIYDPIIYANVLASHPISETQSEKITRLAIITSPEPHCIPISGKRNGQRYNPCPEPLLNTLHATEHVAVRIAQVMLQKMLKQQQLTGGVWVGGVTGVDDNDDCTVSRNAELTLRAQFGNIYDCDALGGANHVHDVLEHSLNRAISIVEGVIARNP